MAFYCCNIAEDLLPDTFTLQIPVSVAMTYYHATGSDDRDGSTVSMSSSGSTSVMIGTTQYNVTYSGSAYNSGGRTSKLSANGTITATFEKAYHRGAKAGLPIVFMDMHYMTATYSQSTKTLDFGDTIFSAGVTSGRTIEFLYPVKSFVYRETNAVYKSTLTFYASEDGSNWIELFKYVRLGTASSDWVTLDVSNKNYMYFKAVTTNDGSESCNHKLELKSVVLK